MSRPKGVWCVRCLCLCNAIRSDNHEWSEQRAKKNGIYCFRRIFYNQNSCANLHWRSNAAISRLILTIDRSKCSLNTFEWFRIFSIRLSLTDNKHISFRMNQHDCMCVCVCAMAHRTNQVQVASRTMSIINCFYRCLKTYQSFRISNSFIEQWSFRWIRRGIHNNKRNGKLTLGIGIYLLWFLSVWMSLPRIVMLSFAPNFHR